ncbi:MAG: helix-turn-helix transcriptional regulator [Clostridiales bacterium]|nr:helix-turn-helix transcriptional regulator [Clostridiales bacterium]
MKSLYSKLRDARANLHLSQEYVAKCLGVSCSVVNEIEQGHRTVSKDEIERFCEIYGLSDSYLLDNPQGFDSQQIYTRTFNELVHTDQQEILSLISLRKEMAKRKRT